MINAFELKCYRNILKILWTEHRTNKSIRDELKVEDQWFENSVENQKLKYFCRLKRSEALGKIIMEGKIDGKKRKRKTRKAVGKGHTEQL